MTEIEGIPVTIYDNGGRTFDRYSVVFDDPDMADGFLAVGPTGNYPNGVCMWIEGTPWESGSEEIEYADVPEPVQRAIVGEIRFQREILEQYGR